MKTKQKTYCPECGKLKKKPWLADSTSDIFVHRRKTQEMKSEDRVYCSFCYHTDREVQHLIVNSTTRTYICDECADDCVSAIELLKCDMVSIGLSRGRCSFCHKEHNSVEYLFANFENGKYICNECAELCSEIFKEEAAKDRMS